VIFVCLSHRKFLFVLRTRWLFQALRKYPSALAGGLYPDGIPTVAEADLPTFLRKNSVDDVVFAYSDASNQHVMHVASMVLAAGSTFKLLPPKATMINAKVPVIAVTAVRTGVGKSAVSLRVMSELKERGIKAVAVREPMPYGDLLEQRCMKFETAADLQKHGCTVEEREEYEQYVENGMTIFSGVHYETIADTIAADSSVQAIVFDGGNNEISFFVPDTLICLADALRPGHELLSHPGKADINIACCAC
jgi:predicted GTPase